ncbi:MAG: hypothetical protein FWG82_01770 [Oscillospiraceae bacterium]|nr:hypothetical protein [Oscillospiraceae bacterium]
MKSHSERLYSKRNEVYRIGNIVQKHHKNDETAALEEEFLTRLHRSGLPVPHRVVRNEKILTMPYIPAEPLSDVIARWESVNTAEIDDIARKLVQWLADFYTAVEVGEIRGDVNCHNFLWDGQRVFGVDFEERIFGEKEMDIGRLLAFVLTYSCKCPAALKALAAAILESAQEKLGVRPWLITDCRDREFDAIRERRGQVRGSGNL